MFSFCLGITSWQACDKGHLCTSRSLWKTCDPSWPVLYFLGLFWFTPLQGRSGSSVVNVLIHIIVKGPLQRRLYFVSGILELKKVSYLIDDTQCLWRHLYNKKSCHHEGQYVTQRKFEAAPSKILMEKTHLSCKIKSQTWAGRENTTNFNAANEPNLSNFSFLLLGCEVKSPVGTSC